MTIKRRRILSFSLLEPRLMLAADIFVNMTADENDGIDIGGVSLREAVQHAEQAEVSWILFTEDLQNQTIFLDAAFGALEINDDLTIDGQGKNVSIRGEDVTNVFKITGGDVTIKNLTLPTVVIESGSTTRLGGSVVGDLINNGTLAVASDGTNNNGGNDPVTPAALSEDLNEVSRWGKIAFASAAAIGRCLEVTETGSVILAECDLDQPTQFVQYDEDSQTLRTEDERCWNANAQEIAINDCDAALVVTYHAHGQIQAHSSQGQALGCLTLTGVELGQSPTLQSCDDQNSGLQSWGIQLQHAPLEWETIVDGAQKVILDSDYYPVAAISGRAVPLLSGADGRFAAAIGVMANARFVNFGSWRGVHVNDSSGPYVNLFKRLVAWAGRTQTPVVGLVPFPHQSGLRFWLERIGVSTLDISFGEDEDWSGIDLLILDAGHTPARREYVAQIEDFLRNGGGVMAGRHVFLPWETSTYAPEDDLTGRIMTLGGISWTQDAYQAIDPGTSVTVQMQLPSKLTSAEGALEALARDILGIEALSQDDRNLIARTLRFNGSAPTRMRSSDRLVWVSKALTRHLGPLIIGPDNHFTWEEDPARDAQLYADYIVAQALGPHQTIPHPSHQAFPGALPEDAQPVDVRVTLDGNVTPGGGLRWRSTGYYAPPGIPVTVRIDDSLVDAGLALRLGTAFDNPMREVGWLEPGEFERFPWVTSARRLIHPETTFATAFGGPVVLVVPEGSNLGEIELDLRGVIAMPIFKLGETTPEAWAEVLSSTHAPLGELASPEVIFTLRTEVLRELGDPSEHLALLANMVRGESYFVGRIEEGGQDIDWPQRLVFDPFEAWGAHAGYPVHMTQSWDHSLLDRLIWPGGFGLWGFTHEIGHNYQRSAWTLASWGEVTCNLIGAYAIAEVAGIPLEQAWDGNLEPGRIRSDTESWLAAGGGYETQGYGVALYFLLFLKDGFGWDLWRDFFVQMEAIPQGAWPNNDSDKIDNMVIRLSQIAGVNLAPFFQRFRFPVSEQAIAATRELPDWTEAPY